MLDTHYALQVTRLEGSREWENMFDINFKATVNGRTMTGAIANSGSQTGVDTVAFALQDTKSSLLHLQLKKPPVFANIILNELMENCNNGEAKVNLYTKTGRSHTGAIYVNLRVVNEEERVEVEIKNVEQCIKRINRSANASDSAANSVGSVVRKLDEVVKAVDQVVGKTHSYLNLTWQLTVVLYRVVSHQFKRDKKLVDLVHLMKETFKFARDTRNVHEKITVLEDLTADLFDHAIGCSNFVQDYTKRRFLGRMVSLTSERQMDDYKERFTELKRKVDSAISLYTANLVRNICSHQQLEWLEKRLNPTSSDTSTRPRCLASTRTKYIEQIMDWLFSFTDQNILWLKGIAGSGKSTIAASIRDVCDSQMCLAAYMFFERGKDEHKSVIRSVAYQLASFKIEIAENVVAAVERTRHVEGATVVSQFEALLSEPLKAAANAVEGPLLIILDALDECGTAEQRREILKLLREEFAGLPVKFRFLVTSRPENDIMVSLSSRNHILEVELDHTSADSRRDVNTYLEKEMREAIEAKEKKVPNDWNNTMKKLDDAAKGLFIWASTATRMVRSRKLGKLERLRNLAQNIESAGNYGLDELYATALRESGVTGDDAESQGYFRRVLSLVLFAKEPLTCEVIDGIVGTRDGMSCQILEQMQSVIFYEPGKPPRVHHASFGDYLTSPERSGGHSWSIDVHLEKQAITSRCFDVMKDLLHFNICNLETSFVCNDCVSHLDRRVEEYVVPRLSYACRFWAEHLLDVPYFPICFDLLDGLRNFAYNRLLYWLEVLSLTSCFSRIASRSLYNISMSALAVDKELSAFLWDAYKLTSSFALPISQSAPHIYLSALSLRKGESVVCDHYSRTHPTVGVQVLGRKPPDPCIKILKDAWRVFVSSDGQYIASGSSRTVRIWDAESGELALDLLELEPYREIMSVAFMSDGKRVAAVTEDGSICVWSTESGDFVLDPFECFRQMVTAAAFSRDGRHFVAGFHDGSIRICDVENGSLVVGPLKEHKSTITALAFSCNGDLITSGSKDCSIRVWNANTGAVIRVLLGNTRVVVSVNISPDGKYVASGSWDLTIRVWRVDSGEIVWKAPGWAPCIAFSHDGKLLASGGPTICIWDTASGKLASGPLWRDAESVNTLAFFPDGRRIVTGSSRGLARIWDVQSSNIDSGILEDCKNDVLSVAFSPDGRHVASGHINWLVRIWDVQSGKLLLGRPFEGHTDTITCVTYSPDGKLVAFASSDGSVRIWNVESSQTALELKHGESRASVSFSPNGRQVAAGTSKGTLLVWNAHSGEVILGPLKEAEMIWSVMFSPDGHRIASASDDHSLRVYDATSGEVVLGPLTGHTGPIESAAFSPEGRWIASGSWDKTIRIWSAETGETVFGPLKGHTGLVNSVSFSPNGKYLASGSDDRSIRVWEVGDMQTISRSFTGHRRPVRSVAFSPCGKYVASGSHDGTIRIWDIEIKTAEDTLDEYAQDDSFCSTSLSSDQRITSTHWNAAAGIAGVPGTATPTLPKKRTPLNWSPPWDDGWIRGDDDELMIWIPEDMHKTIRHPCNTCILNCQFLTELDFARSPLGANWSKGYSLSLSHASPATAMKRSTCESENLIQSPPHIRRRLE